MAESTIEDLLARLERERQQADRAYNDALTAVDRAIQSPLALTELPTVADSSALSGLQHQAERTAGRPGSFTGRVVRSLLRRAGFDPDQLHAFNLRAVEQLERHAIAHDGLNRSMAALQDRLRQHSEELARFQSLLVQYLQTLTAYIDTKDRALGGSELRDRLAIVEQRMMAIKRAVEQGGAGRAQAASLAPPAAPAGTTAIFAGDVDASAYVGFEDRFRGVRDEIRGRVEDYVPLLAAHANVVDIGCGRGELLDLLRARGVPARGVDVNDAMVALCRDRGLDAERSDALTYLEAQPDSSVGGLIAIQVVEHFAPGYLARFLEAAYQKLKPGSPLILETLNPACWMAFFECYIRDLTHERPLHPDTLRYLVEASGFTQVDVQYRQPVRALDRLDRVPLPPDATSEGERHIAALTSALNAHADKLNARLFSSMDYAVVARR